jgi:hypothetical protein
VFIAAVVNNTTCRKAKESSLSLPVSWALFPLPLFFLSSFFSPFPSLEVASPTIHILSGLFDLFIYSHVSNFSFGFVSLFAPTPYVESSECSPFPSYLRIFPTMSLRLVCLPPCASSVVVCVSTVARNLLCCPTHQHRTAEGESEWNLLHCALCQRGKRVSVHSLLLRFFLLLLAKLMVGKLSLWPTEWPPNIDRR